MIKCEYNINGYTILKRINKRIARKAYNNGLYVLFIPCKCSPTNTWFNLGIWEHKQLDGQYETFDKLCNAFEWYNCNNETGRYITFYIPVCWEDRFSGERQYQGYYTENYNAIETYDYKYIREAIKDDTF